MSRTDKAIMAKFSNAIWEQSWWTYGMQDWMMDLVTKPEVPSAIMGKVCEIAMGLLEVGLRQIGDLVDILRLSGEDLGTQQGPMISLDMFRRMVRPHFERLWTFAKEEFLKRNPAGKVMGLFDRSNLVRVKEAVGENLCIVGGMPVTLLHAGTPEQVRDETRRVIDTIAADGGFIMSVSSVLDEADPELIRIWVQETQEYGVY